MKKNLSYYLPKPQKPHTILRIPGSHTLYVGPVGCMRRHYMHAAQYGDLSHVSFLEITNWDIVSGFYEKEIERSIAELLQVIEPTPHIFIISVFCIDDFLATDEQSMLKRLEKKHPDCRFGVEHIAPMNMNEEKGILMKRKTSNYAFLKPESVHDRGINFIGNFVSLPEDCEFLHLIKEWGYGPVRELFTCDSYETYQAMAKSCLSIGFRLGSMGDATLMEEELGIPYYYFPASYDAEFVARGYAHIAALSGQIPPDFTPQITACKIHAKETASLLREKGLFLSVDSKASLLPFSMGLALLNYGLPVNYVFSKNKPFKQDLPAYHELKKRGVNLMFSDDYLHIISPRQQEDCVAIGADSAKILGTKYTVDLWHDEGHFGFQGIHKLLDEIQACLLNR